MKLSAAKQRLEFTASSIRSCVHDQTFDGPTPRRQAEVETDRFLRILSDHFHA